METLINQDYEFDRTSLIYGKFLQEVHESYPDVIFTDVAKDYPYKSRFITYTHIAVPESVATILKLRFGNHLRVPPIKDDTDNMNTPMTKSLSTKKYFPPHWKESPLIIDYASILKTERELCSKMKLNDLYNNLWDDAE